MYRYSNSFWMPKTDFLILVKRGITGAGKPPVPEKSERKPPPSGAPPPPPVGSRPELMKQSSSFTTEDMDLFGSKSSLFSTR